jgi:succinate-semialdehyde dehydrogenase/glutarate-semialdehyde dehydrogenase
MGEPTDETSYYGPMARTIYEMNCMNKYKTVAQEGSSVLEDTIKGAYYPATILADLKPGMEGFDNELFGPVASVIQPRMIRSIIG